jgi:hypothetical protein
VAPPLLLYSPRGSCPSVHSLYGASWSGIKVVRNERKIAGTLTVGMLFLLSSIATAKMVGKSVQVIQPLPISKRNALLNYPPLPPEILERIAGKTLATLRPTKVPTLLGQDWGLVNIGFFDLFTPLVQPLQTSLDRCSQDVVVAVVDTGIDYTHVDLKRNIWVNKGETGRDASGRDKSSNGIDDDGNGFVDDVVGYDFVNNQPLPYDTHGHGTHIAGIIGAESSDGVGVVGVCPNVTIMSLKYYDNSGIGYNNLQNTVRAIQYAVKMGANIINYSGGGADPAPSEKAAIEEAQRKGILFVAAAGNDGHNNDYIPYFPASYGLDNIISVASINPQNKLLPSSNYGPRSVNIAAPGYAIISSLPGSKFGTMSGTSQATAFVTGAAALLESQIKHHGTTDYRKIKLWLTEGTKMLPGNENKALVSAGMLSVSKSFAMEKSDFKLTPTAPVVSTELALRPGTKP